ncbi:MAG: 8-amino-7-oxononanoate synthase [Waddliaceae bacterium]|nr:8-amino-7-oxononanoate synthase [Waddliaceae bacterium]
MPTTLTKNKFIFIEKELEEKTRRFQRRVFLQNQTDIIDFTSNDYLGFSQNDCLIERSKHFTQCYGVGAQASRLLSGNLPCHENLEEKLKSLSHSEAIVLMNSGFQANISTLPALANRHSLLIMDRLVHNSLVQGALLSKATIWRYRHQDLIHMESLLKKASEASFNRIIVLTESLFGMDGDQTDLSSFCSLCEKYGAISYIDEAHAFGVFGKNGMGLVEPSMKADFVLRTFGKALGSFGACISGSQMLIDFLCNFCNGLIYATALPPPILGAVDGALDLLPSMCKERKQLQEKAKLLREELRKLDYDTGLSDSHLIPLIMGKENNALDLSNYLKSHKILAMAIRPPTVPSGESRLRLSIRLNHSEEDFEALFTALASYKGPRHA